MPKKIQKLVVRHLSPKELMEGRVDYRRYVLIVSLVVAAILAVISILNQVDAWKIRPDDAATPSNEKTYFLLDMIVVATAIAIGPIGFYINMQQQIVRGIEKRLPDFLRDVAEAGRFGMTLADSIVVAAGGRYGPLGPEIRKMAAQIEWGVPANDALRLFADRVDTPVTRRIIAVIIKSNDSGGNVADVLTMVAHDAKEAQLKKDERKIAMGTYLAVIYISFFVFLVTILILNGTFLPKMEEAGRGLTEATAAMSGGAGTIALPTRIEYTLIPNLKLTFILASVVHAVGDGILAGCLTHGKVSNGLQHSTVLLAVGYAMLRLTG